MSKFLQGIDTVILRVKDVKESTRWYAEKLSLVTDYEDPLLHLAVMNTGGPTSLTLWQTEALIAHTPETSAYPIFKTADAAAAREALVQAGVRADPIITDHAVTYFRFYDPDGNVMEACQIHN